MTTLKSKFWASVIPREEGLKRNKEVILCG